MVDIVCCECGKRPEEIDEYIPGPGKYNEDMNPVDYVIQEEGTYNPTNGHFCCTDCYVKIGMPSSPTGWRAP